MNHANNPLSRGGYFVSRDLKSFIYARLASWRERTSKIEETVDFLVPRSTCFIARHISKESPLKKIFKKRLKEFQKHLRERGYPQNLLNLTLSLSLSLKYTLKTRKKHFNKNLQEGKRFCPLSRKINHQFLALKAFS